KYTADATRSPKEQMEGGGEERGDDDDGGHIVARILGGADGVENLVPMRRTINRGDYKKMENEIASARKDGKEVSLHIDLEYEDSKRPSIIRARYTIDGKETTVEFDNRENSTELMDSLAGKISSRDLNSLRDEVEDMKDAGIDASLTSVKTEYDEMGNPEKITVGLLDESTGIKTYRSFYAN
ncbi:MAG: DNA/RNA non-specific endonuclease, partial [Clostridiales bacterium]|nr:DNA/RNA non-specific endonuclease [Clostridiales bacterium]